MYSINDEGADDVDELSRKIGGSIWSRHIEVNEKDFNLDTMGGDASLLHLISLIDAGISRRIRQKQGARADFFHKIYKYCEPVKFIIVGVYIMMTQFEQPAFCLDIIKKKAADPNNSGYADFDERICNDSELNYTCWDILPKFTPAITRPIEIGCLILLLVIQLIRN